MSNHPRAGTGIEALKAKTRPMAYEQMRMAGDIWRDLNGNGVTDSGELKTPTESGITEISLAASTPAQGSIRGNTIRADATFTRADGSTSVIADVILQNNPTDSKYLGDTTVSSAAAATAMNLKGRCQA